MYSGRAGTTDFETTVFLGYFKDMPDHRQPGLRHVIRPSWAVPNGGGTISCSRSMFVGAPWRASATES